MISILLFKTNVNQLKHIIYNRTSITNTNSDLVSSKLLDVEYNILNAEM